MEEKDGLPICAFATDAEFAEWLAKNIDAAGLWIKFGKKSNPEPSVTYAEALDVALCYGWIDGQKHGYDEQWFLLRFTPRRTHSKWSQRNRAHVERLTAAGRMQPTGLAAVEAAKADGRWEAAYASQRNVEVPADLAAALAANPAATATFEALTSVDRYAILYRITTVKRQATRERKIAEYVHMLAEGTSIHSGPVSKWPRGVSQPAIRALTGAGYESIDDLRGVDLSTLAGLHGVGPKALRIIAEDLR